jgi:hypothetical protein
MKSGKDVNTYLQVYDKEKHPQFFSIKAHKDGRFSPDNKKSKAIW